MGAPDGPTAAPTPECTSNQDCDDGDTCTVDTCENGLCLSTPDCASCGKTKVDVEITIDNYGGETTYDITDNSGTSVMKGSGWPANSVNSFWMCFSSGSYTFTITDAYGDGICCSYGNGGYSVKVDDKEVASGGDFDSSETKTFDVGSSTPTTPAPVPTTPTPAPSAITSPPSAADSTWETYDPTNSETTGKLIPPTLFPTHTPPTMFPTGTPPTLYPTHTVPTMYPTPVACAPKNEPCTEH